MSTEKQKLEEHIAETQAKIQELGKKLPDIIYEIYKSDFQDEFQQQKQKKLDDLADEIQELESRIKPDENTEIDRNENEALKVKIQSKELQIKQIEDTLNYFKLQDELSKFKEELQKLNTQQVLSGKVNSSGKPEVEVVPTPSISNIPKNNATSGLPPRAVKVALDELEKDKWKKEVQKDGTKIYTAPEKNSKNQDIKFEVKGNSINISKDVEYDKKVGDMLVKLASAELATSKNIVVFHPDPDEAKRLADSLKQALSKYNSDAKITVTNDYKEYENYIKNGIPPEKTQPKSEADLTITTQPKPVEKVEKTETEQLDTESTEKVQDEPDNKNRPRSKTF